MDQTTQRGTLYRWKQTKPFSMGLIILEELICSTEMVVSEFRLEVLDIKQKGMELLAGLKAQL